MSEQGTDDAAVRKRVPTKITPAAIVLLLAATFMFCSILYGLIYVLATQAVSSEATNIGLVAVLGGSIVLALLIGFGGRR